MLQHAIEVLIENDIGSNTNIILIRKKMDQLVRHRLILPLDEVYEYLLNKKVPFN
jgi:hypothetical protein